MNNLGNIPSWQFSRDPAQNPNLTPFMQMPPGMYQTTRQPIGPYMTGMNGLGQVVADMPVQAPPSAETMMPPPPSITDVLAVPDVPQTFTSPEQLVVFHNQFMSTWWWRNRRALGIGIAIALGLGVVGGVSAILR